MRNRYSARAVAMFSTNTQNNNIPQAAPKDMPDQLPDDDPRGQHLGVYHWLTFVQDSLVRVRLRA